MDDFGPILEAIEAKPASTKIFIRDDDAPWSIDRLGALTQRCDMLDLPLDIAVIPTAIDAESASQIVAMCKRSSGRVRLHQHGYGHVNHQLAGRKSEFGNDRDASLQRRDVSIGRSQLLQHFGDLLDPIFTPPWNRCAPTTINALASSDLTVLSRIVGSDLLTLGDMLDLPVAVDWQKKRDGIRLNGSEFAEYAAGQVEKYDVVGIMLHHAEMNSAELDRFSSFAKSLCQSENVEFFSMMRLVTHLEFAHRHSA